MSLQSHLIRRLHPRSFNWILLELERRSSAYLLSISLSFVVTLAYFTLSVSYAEFSCSPWPFKLKLKCKMAKSNKILYLYVSKATYFSILASSSFILLRPFRTASLSAPISFDWIVFWKVMVKKFCKIIFLRNSSIIICVLSYLGNAFTVVSFFFHLPVNGRLSSIYPNNILTKI